jgi:hypothetical protein
MKVPKRKKLARKLVAQSIPSGRNCPNCGEPCQAFNEERIVARSETPSHWCNEFVGQKRKCVRVIYGREEFFLDDEDGSATYKIFQGRGSPWLSHKELIVEL